MIFIFEINLNKRKDSHVLRNKDKPITSTRFTDIFVNICKVFVPNLKKLGLRSGNATKSANVRI